MADANPRERASSEKVYRRGVTAVSLTLKPCARAIYAVSKRKEVAGRCVNVGRWYRMKNAECGRAVGKCAGEAVVGRWCGGEEAEGNSTGDRPDMNENPNHFARSI